MAFDSASSASQEATTSPITWSHTCSGSDRALVVYITYQGNTDDITGVTYDGVAMSKFGDAIDSGGVRTVVGYKLSGPSTGANTISVSHNGNFARFGLFGMSFTGRLQDTANLTKTPASNSGGVTSASISVTSDTDDDVCDGIIVRLESPTAGAGQTQRGAEDITGSGTRCSTSDSPASPSTTMSWSWDGDSARHAHLGVALKPAETGGAPAITGFMGTLGVGI